GISDLIAVSGEVNLDFADVKTIMTNQGSALMGIGVSSGENRAIEAAKKAISSPLLETSIVGAQGVLMNITGGESISLFESHEDEIVVTVIATGFNEKSVNRTPEREEKRDSVSYPSSQRVDDTPPSRPAREMDRSTPETKDDDYEVPTFLRNRSRRRR